MTARALLVTAALALAAAGCNRSTWTDEAIKGCGPGNVAKVDSDHHRYECKR